MASPPRLVSPQAHLISHRNPQRPVADLHCWVDGEPWTGVMGTWSLFTVQQLSRKSTAKGGVELVLSWPRRSCITFRMSLSLSESQNLPL